MGEYANYKGQSVKIGTCEDMYYLRYDQRHLVEAIDRNEDPADERTNGQIRFRFPFPDEDHNEPGAFNDFDRSYPVPGDLRELLQGVEHSSLQFSRNYPRNGGVILSTPCPESEEGKASGLKFTFNGYAGPVGICQQRRIGDELWTVCACGACGAKFRLPFEEAEIVAVAFRQEADRDRHDARSSAMHAIADRILAGYRKARIPA